MQEEDIFPHQVKLVEPLQRTYCPWNLMARGYHFMVLACQWNRNHCTDITSTGKWVTFYLNGALLQQERMRISLQYPKK